MKIENAEILAPQTPSQNQKQIKIYLAVKNLHPPPLQKMSILIFEGFP